MLLWLVNVKLPWECSIFIWISDSSLWALAFSLLLLAFREKCMVCVCSHRPNLSRLPPLGDCQNPGLKPREASLPSHNKISPVAESIGQRGRGGWRRQQRGKRWWDLSGRKRVEEKKNQIRSEMKLGSPALLFSFFFRQTWKRHKESIWYTRSEAEVWLDQGYLTHENTFNEKTNYGERPQDERVREFTVGITNRVPLPWIWLCYFYSLEKGV